MLIILFILKFGTKMRIIEREFIIKFNLYIKTALEKNYF